MIDLDRETLLSVTAARDWLRSHGAAPHRNTVYRWLEEGRLESVKIGGRRYTSKEALQRMATRGQDVIPIHQHQRRRRRSAVQEDAWVDEELRRLGVLQED